ncbi:hypothetical protein CAPTEDRAFT_188369 [Capitella teleta]|uniref:Profilin n=1 Tax=Capitella teleta TaxID=283909 RepID=R7VIZ0_CAPTE|nr:hypothetical protein CAPTEDRAFT_188369 [Capitella teleta]|eukprot:ELU18527.1 hypothetical protein CAPTEDRAFT_188369 [Capitella teleta]
MAERTILVQTFGWDVKMIQDHVIVAKGRFFQCIGSLVSYDCLVLTYKFVCMVAEWGGGGATRFTDILLQKDDVQHRLDMSISQFLSIINSGRERWPMFRVRGGLEDDEKHEEKVKAINQVSPISVFAMLGLLTSSMPVLPAASSQKSCWGFWVDHILKQKQLGFRKAALLNASTGAVVASSGFSLSDKDVANLKDCSVERTRDSLKFDGKTYIIKEEADGQVVAFNGRSYLIVSRSRTMYVIAVCQSRKKNVEAASWVKHLRDRLVAKNF